MHQMVIPIKSALKEKRPVQKRTLEDQDLQIVADLVCDGLREGLYVDLLTGQNRSDVVRFLRHLVTKCEIRHYDRIKRCFRKRAAALFVYTIEDAVVGFGVLGQVFSNSIRNGFHSKVDNNDRLGTGADHAPVIPGNRIPPHDRLGEKNSPLNLVSGDAHRTSNKNGVELLMLGVVPAQRGLGYGASILDSLTQRIAHQHFNFIVQCPSDNPLLFAMLIAHGFLAVGRYGQGRILRFLPQTSDNPSWRSPTLSLYSE